MLIAWTDGSITGGAWGPKKGPPTTPHGWCGWVVKDSDGRVLAHKSLDLGAADFMSGNVAEYMGLRSALAWMLENHPHQVVAIHSDSQLIVNQMTGRWNCYDDSLVGLRDACRALANRFPSVSYTWIPREENREADVLSKGLQLWDHVPSWAEVQEQLTKKGKK